MIRNMKIVIYVEWIIPSTIINGGFWKGEVDYLHRRPHRGKLKMGVE